MSSVIVTGASKGLGESICTRLRKGGFRIIGISRTRPKIEIDEWFEADVSNSDELAIIAKQIRRSKQNVFALINAAGIASMNLSLMTDKETTKRIIEVNLLGTIYSCQSFAPLLVRGQEGRIINFSTIAVSLALQGEAIYSASKAAVETFSTTLARELSQFNITVNTIAPGPVKTDLISGVPEKKIAKIIEQQIIRKYCSRDDVADIVELLLSQKADKITGEVLNVGGAS